MVDQDAPAGKAGLKEHDVILSVNGSAVQSVEQLRRMIREIPAGRAVTLGISRGGQPLTLKAQLTDRKNAVMVMPEVRTMKSFKMDLPDMSVLQDMDIPASVVVVHSSARSGLMVENLTPQLGTFFGAKDGQGILVRSVEKGSVAEKAGFHAGDVIVKVNNDPISDTGDFTHTLRSGRDSGKANTISVGIIRDKKEQTLSLTLPERKRSEMREESFAMPDVNAEMRVEMDQVRTQMAKVKPEMMRYAEEMKRMQPELEKAAKEAVEQQKEMQDFQEELRDQQKDYQELLHHRLVGGADI